MNSIDSKTKNQKEISIDPETISPLVSLEAEVPEDLYEGMKDFIYSNPSWDQYQVMSSALANFLYQNGCTDRAVTERYLDDLFKS